jgi:uncharacterized iron-regulated protein
MKYLLIILLTIFTIGEINAQSKPAYLIYQKSGERLDYSEVMRRAMEAELIFFGELHNNTIAHWLQLEMTIDLASDSTKEFMIGMEMFEADQQVLIDEYFSGLISRSSFEQEARLWRNYATDYKPVLEYARENGHHVIATNIPRRYASMVYSGGLEVLDDLSDEAKNWMMPLPVEVDTELPGYQNMSAAAHGHGGVNLIYSQAVKDATMAHFILKNFTPNSRIFHLNGSYHSNNYEGIVWYIKRDLPGVKVLTINTITEDDITSVETDKLQAADITIVVPSRMTTTY